MNAAYIGGHLTDDIELKTTANGVTMTSFTVAVRDDHNPEKTDFLPCIAWNKTAEFLSRYGRRGSYVVLYGKQTVRKYKNKDGENRVKYETEIRYVDRIIDPQNKSEKRQEEGSPEGPAPVFEEAVDGDLPF